MSVETNFRKPVRHRKSWKYKNRKEEQRMASFLQNSKSANPKRLPEVVFGFGPPLVAV
jgi:hypothetical protein